MGVDELMDSKSVTETSVTRNVAVTGHQPVSLIDAMDPVLAPTSPDARGTAPAINDDFGLFDNEDLFEGAKALVPEIAPKHPRSFPAIPMFP